MENIAIIGIANLFPVSNSPDDFWQGLLNKKDNRKIATNEQMGLDPKKYLGKKGETDKYYCLHGGYIEKYKFNIDKFNINAKYLSQLHDLHHFSLFVAKKALQNAGKIDSTELSRCGTILGNLSFPTKSSNQIFIPLYNEIIERHYNLLYIQILK